MKLLFALAGIALIQGCSSTTKQVVLDRPDPVLKRIEQIATTIAHNSAQLNDLEAARYRNVNGEGVSSADLSALPHLTQVVSLGGEYHGPLEPFITQLSRVSGLNPPRILNLRPSADILVSLNTDYRPVIDIMRDVGAQSGTRAQITYKAAENLFELEYQAF